MIMSSEQAVSVSGGEKTPELNGFELLETMLWSSSEGYFLLDYHLQRLADAAETFRVPLDADLVRRQLAGFVEKPGPDSLRVRLTVDRRGEPHVSAVPLEMRFGHTLQIAWSRNPVNSASPFLYFKTTNRTLYDSALAECPKADDVLLFNKQDEVTETCLANIAVARNGHFVTPPVSCGLLNGTYRRWLLEQGKLVEDIVHRHELEAAAEFYVFNSVKKWCKACLLPEEEAEAS